MTPFHKAAKLGHGPVLDLYGNIVLPSMGQAGYDTKDAKVRRRMHAWFVSTCCFLEWFDVVTSCPALEPGSDWAAGGFAKQSTRVD